MINVMVMSQLHITCPAATEATSQSCIQEPSSSTAEANTTACLSSQWPFNPDHYWPIRSGSRVSECKWRGVCVCSRTHDVWCMLYTHTHILYIIYKTRTYTVSICLFVCVFFSSCFFIIFLKRTFCFELIYLPICEIFNWSSALWSACETRLTDTDSTGAASWDLAHTNGTAKG